MIQDFRFAFRALARRPGFAIVAMAALALGVGANTAIFTVVNAVLLTPLPYPQPDRLTLVMRQYRQADVPTISVLKFDYWRRNNRSFESVTAFDVMGSGYNLTGSGDPERILGLRVAGPFFRTIGVAPAIGRDFLPEEDRPGGPRALVMSHGLWQRRFGGDPSLVGRPIVLSGESFVVAGIMPADFRWAPEADIWIPLQGVVVPNDISNYLLCAGRLRAGVTVEQARADMADVGKRLRQEMPQVMEKDEGIGVHPAQDFLTGPVRPMLLILLGAVGLVLLIACANVANLLLSRAAGRDREIAVRIALGAGRLLLIRQLLTESTLLALGGGMLGLLLGYWGVRLLLAFSPMKIPLFVFGLDTHVLGFTLGVSLLTGLLFGLAPALQMTRTDLNTSLKEGGTRTTATAGRGRLRNILVVCEVALALVLVTGASLLVESLLRVRAARSGFDPTNVLTMQMSLSGPRFEKPAQVDTFFRQALRRIEALPGVESAATVTSLPLELGPDFPFEIEGITQPGDTPGAQWRAVTPHYFSTLRIPLLAGRAFAETDSAESAPVILISEGLAKRYWKGGNPVGDRMMLARIQGAEFKDPTRQIIGVVANVREGGLDKEPPPVLYVPVSQVPETIHGKLRSLLPANWVIRTKVPPLNMEQTIRREFLSVDPLQPVSNVRTMDRVIGQSLTVRSFGTLLLGMFAGLALVLASVGIYGVMSYSVSQRTHEIGVRMALGADRMRMLGLVLRQALTLSLVGIAIGLAGAAALMRLLGSLLYGVEATNPITFAGVALVLVAVSVVSAIVPAHRATRIDPIQALHYE